MSERETKVKNKESFKNELQEEFKIENGLADALFGSNVASTQISQTDTLFKSNRWYLVSNMRQLLSELYIEHGIVKTVVDMPVDDAFRGGVKIKTSQLSPEEISLLEKTIEREGDMQIVAEALKWTRLFGGGGVIIVIPRDSKKELKIESIKEGEKVKFKAVDMWELYYSKQETDDYEAAIDGSTLGEQEFFDYYGKALHKTRVIRMKGLRAPSFIRPRLRGWGLSVLEALVRPINQYLKSTDLSFEVLDEFKVDVYKIKGLTSALSAKGGTAKIQQRVQLANQQKNYQSAITMDAEDDYTQKQVSFTGLAEAMDSIRKQLASDLRIPMTKLFGQSAAGFNSGEDDIENYNAMIESTIRAKSKFEIMKIHEIRCMTLFGHIPEDLEIEFEPLRVMSSVDVENVKTQKFGRTIQARQAGEISTEDFKEAVNKDDLLPTQVEVNDETFAVAAPTPSVSIPSISNETKKDK